MVPLTISREYGALLAKTPPKVIRTEKENDAYSEILYDLDRRHNALTIAEIELADLLTLLIEDSEAKRYPLPRSKPLNALRFLMEQHELRQKDIVDVFGTPSIVSEVLSGRREFTATHIKRLSRRFHASPEIFF